MSTLCLLKPSLITNQKTYSGMEVKPLARSSCSTQWGKVAPPPDSATGNLLAKHHFSIFYKSYKILQYLFTKQHFLNSKFHCKKAVSVQNTLYRSLFTWLFWYRILKVLTPQETLKFLLIFFKPPFWRNCSQLFFIKDRCVKIIHQAGLISHLSQKIIHKQQHHYACCEQKLDNFVNSSSGVHQ